MFGGALFEVMKQFSCRTCRFTAFIFSSECKHHPPIFTALRCVFHSECPAVPFSMHAAASSDKIRIPPAPFTDRPSARAPPAPPLEVPPASSRPRLPAPLVCSPADTGRAVNPLTITPRASSSPPNSINSAGIFLHSLTSRSLQLPLRAPHQHCVRVESDVDAMACFLLPARWPSWPSTPRRRRPGLPPKFQPARRRRHSGPTPPPQSPLPTPISSPPSTPLPVPPTPCGRRQLAVAYLSWTADFASPPIQAPPPPPFLALTPACAGADTRSCRRPRAGRA